LELPGYPAVSRVGRVAVPSDSPTYVCVYEINLRNTRTKSLIRQDHLLPGHAGVRSAITETAYEHVPSVIRVDKIKRISAVRICQGGPGRTAVGGSKQTLRDAGAVADHITDIAIDKLHVANEKHVRQTWIAD
jgi:hypothetical protein